MKKLFSVVLAAVLLMGCVPALATTTPTGVQIQVDGSSVRIYDRVVIVVAEPTQVVHGVKVADHQAPKAALPAIAAALTAEVGKEIQNVDIVGLDHLFSAAVLEQIQALPLEQKVQAILLVLDDASYFDPATGKFTGNTEVGAAAEELSETQWLEMAANGSTESGFGYFTDASGKAVAFERIVFKFTRMRVGAYANVTDDSELEYYVNYLFVFNTTTADWELNSIVEYQPALVNVVG